MSLQIRVPGKAILFGEHAVCQGHTGIAVALRKYLTLDCEVLGGKENLRAGKNGSVSRLSGGSGDGSGNGDRPGENIANKQTEITNTNINSSGSTTSSPTSSTTSSTTSSPTTSIAPRPTTRTNGWVSSDSNSSSIPDSVGGTPIPSPLSSYRSPPTVASSSELESDDTNSSLGSSPNGKLQILGEGDSEDVLMDGEVRIECSLVFTDSDVQTHFIFASSKT
jgi:hypothetical protein